ncbi:MAG TPA: dihydroneopterin aldolase [Candidatus Methylomirabilis sp.]|nr:dihydroneopterin aldolase [Candidatus Methylomirabilis sp.]
MLPSGWLAIEGVRFRCVIGVTDRERELPQEVVASVHIRADFETPAASDSIHDTVDYRTLTRRLIAVGETSRVHLVETLATRLVRMILEEFPGVQEVRVEIEKPGALSAARSVRASAAARRLP